ncbi:alanine racemase [Leucobacter sp. CSA1]|uniref:Alanine racemase n=1 Tax=Leucobacter chromiisoli TaxID=2796471 RepID=A0A934Q907_9MICO|nr:alanine racemase [Leucobacter chromiisoli]MBK0420434.1 alanine racemase [Leucobacter chromiisoli]
MNSIGTTSTPCLVVDVDRMDRNIQHMADVLKNAGIEQRPHFKTSKMIEVAKRQLDAGATGFTCATPGEVEALLSAGITDIFWAHAPATPQKAALAAEFNTKGKVAVGIDSIELARIVSGAADAARQTVPVRIEVDTGLRRTGVLADDALRLVEEIQALPFLSFEGLYTHEGQLASMQGPHEERQQQGYAASRTLVETVERIRSAGHTVDVVSVGSTPGWDSAPFEAGVTEARAGTYVFYDANQWRLGSTDSMSCALTVHATVISTVRPGEVAIDAGIKAMSSDGSNRGNTFGVVIDESGEPIEGISFSRAYEEHGILEGDHSVTSRWRVGDRVRIIPNHACGAVNMWSRVLAVQGNSYEIWNVVGRY